MFTRTLAACVAAIVWASGTAAVELEDRIRNRLEAAYLADSLEVMDERLHAREILRRVYPARAYRPFWVTDAGLTPRGERLAAWLEEGPRRHGLRPADYHLNVVEELDESARVGALVDLEFALSDAFLMVASHFLAGRLDPMTLNSEWYADRRHRDLGPVIEGASSLDTPEAALEELLPKADGYRMLVDRLPRLREVRDHGGWPVIAEGPTLRLGDQGERIAQLKARLLSSGDYESSADRLFDEGLADAVVRFQARHGLGADGLVGRATLAALNISVQSRIDQVIVNLERWRWLPESLGERYIFVNIAGFSLDVLDGDETILSMPVVVGRPYRRTPVFSGSISYLVLNPSWEVPSSIAGRDKLPLIKADPNYLAEQGYTLLQGWGAEERVVDPTTVDWANVTARDFRYRLRQAPGPLNALGEVKFMFPNAHSVYLHDTPARELFGEDARAFSSGCIRLARPLDLAELLLRDAPNWDRPAIERTIAGGAEQTVRLERNMPVHLLYWTAWVDEDGVTQFRDDVYGRDTPVLQELREPPPI